jgi:uncharacterized protein involved in exopolysaccharide biosynthesis
VDLALLFSLISRRWLLIAVSGLVFGMLGAAFAVAAQKEYRAEVVLIPRDSTPGTGLLSQLGQIGGIASLVGLGPSSRNREESLAVLRSRVFLGRFIQQQGISGQLAQEVTRPLPFVPSAGSVSKIPFPDLVEYFDTTIRAIFDDKKTGAVRISITWSDPQLAAEWANAMAEQLNEDVRTRAIQEAEFNIKYLTAELDSSRIMSLKQPIGNLLESEIQRLMVARGTREYAYHVVDPATPPVHHEWPKLLPLSALSAFAGSLLAVLWIVFRFVVRGGLVSREPAAQQGVD